MPNLAAYRIDHAFSHSAPAIQEIKGVLYVVFRQLDNSIAWCSAKAAAHPDWSPLKVIPTVRTKSAPVATTYDGQLVVFFKGEQDPSDIIWYAQLDDGVHNSWSLSSISGTETTTSPGVCVLYDTLYLFWTDTSSARLLWYVTIYNWGNPSQPALVAAFGQSGNSCARAPFAVAVGVSVFLFCTPWNPDGAGPPSIYAFQYPTDSIFGPNSGDQWYGPWPVWNFMSASAPSAAALPFGTDDSLILLWTPIFGAETFNVHNSRYVIPSSGGILPPLWSPDQELTQPLTGGFATAEAVAAVSSGETLYAAWRGKITQDIWFAAFDEVPKPLFPEEMIIPEPQFTVKWLGGADNFSGVTLTLAASGEVNFSGSCLVNIGANVTITARWNDLAGNPYSVQASVPPFLGDHGSWNETTYNQELKNNWHLVFMNLIGNVSNPPAEVQFSVHLG